MSETDARHISQNLVNVDLYRYDETWEQTLSDVIPSFFEAAKNPHDRTCLGQQSLLGFLKPKAGVVILDLREATEFRKQSMPGSFNLPLETLNSITQSPFSNSSVLESQWKELESIFSRKSGTNAAPSADALKDHRVLLLCYDGDTSRVGTSILRAKGVEAVSLEGGMDSLQDLLPGLHVTGIGLPVALDQMWTSSPLLANSSVDCKLVV